MNTIKGQAMLTIERLDSKNVPFDVYTNILRCSGGNGGWESAYQDFCLLETDSLPLPSQAYRLKIGDRIIVKVNFEFWYTRGDGWTTDDDVDLEYTKATVLKRCVNKRNQV